MNEGVQAAVGRAWRPWRRGANGSVIATSQSSWDEVLAWNLAAKKEGAPRPLICGDFDPFETWDGPVHSLNQKPYWWCHGSLSNSPISLSELPVGCRMATLDDFRAKLFAIMGHAKWLSWRIATRHPEHWSRFWPSFWPKTSDDPLFECISHIWIGAHAQTASALSERAPALREIPVAKRFLRLELIEPVHLSGLRGVDWVVVGGMASRNARPCYLDWIRSVVSQCRLANVPCYVERLGSNVWTSAGGKTADSEIGVWGHRRVMLGDCNGGDPNEWPEDLRVREIP